MAVGLNGRVKLDDIIIDIHIVPKIRTTIR